jgi:hypothetical protein
MTTRRRNRDIITAAATLAALAAVPACASDADVPTQADYDEVAEALAPLVAQDLGAGGTLATVATAARGQSVAALRAAAGATAASGASLEWSIEVECRDATGTVQASCNAETDTALVTAGFDGSLELGTYRASLTANGRWSLAGLQSGPVTATGEQVLGAASSFTSTWRNETRTFDLEVSKSYELSFPTLDPRDVRGELSGSVFAHRTRVNPNVDIDKRFDIDVAIELAGDRTAVLVLDGVARYRLDLDTGAITPL